MSGQRTWIRGGVPEECEYEGDACRKCHWRDKCTLVNRTYSTPPDAAEFARREKAKADAE